MRQRDRLCLQLGLVLPNQHRPVFREVTQARSEKSAYDLMLLGIQRLGMARDLEPDIFVSDACSDCGDAVLAMKRSGFTQRSNHLVTKLTKRDPARLSPGKQGQPLLYTCLRCGLEQVPNSLSAIGSQ